MKTFSFFFCIGCVFGFVSLAHAVPVSLTWTDASNNERGFKMYRQVDGAAFQEIAEVAANVVTYQHDVPLDDKNHCYRVTAFNIAGESPPSNTACIVMHSAPPPAPTGLEITITITVQ